MIQISDTTMTQILANIGEYVATEYLMTTPMAELRREAIEDIVTIIADTLDNPAYTYDGIPF